MRLIDADALKAKLKIGANTATYSDYCNGYCDARQVDLDAIDAALTIEPEVQHGRWIPNGKRSVFGDLEFFCSECRRRIVVNWAVEDPSERNAFCSGCGAKMDGGAERCG